MDITLIEKTKNSIRFTIDGKDYSSTIQNPCDFSQIAVNKSLERMFSETVWEEYNKIYD